MLLYNYIAVRSSTLNSLVALLLSKLSKNFKLNFQFRQGGPLGRPVLRHRGRDPLPDLEVGRGFDPVAAGAGITRRRLAALAEVLALAAEVFNAMGRQLDCSLLASLLSPAIDASRDTSRSRSLRHTSICQESAPTSCTVPIPSVSDKGKSCIATSDCRSAR